MKCEYGDGLKVRYTGPLHITNGGYVNVFVKEGLLPEGIKNDLEMALYKNSCGDMRSIAETVTKIYGTRACIHE